MSSSVVATSPIVQLAYVVDDIEATCRQLNAIHGLGPFLTLENQLAGHTYLGSPTGPVELTLAFAQSGDLQIELIKQHCDTPSAFLGQIGGVHHVARFSNDYEADRDALVAAGFPVVAEWEAIPGECAVCMIDTRDDLGHLLELCTDHPFIRGFYAMVRERTDQWDRRELIEPVSLG